VSGEHNDHFLGELILQCPSALILALWLWEQMKMGLFVDYLQQPLNNREELKVSRGKKLYSSGLPVKDADTLLHFISESQYCLSEEV